ncbi:MAG: hypothetical protein QOJ91_286 [Sphingomonadales bacterium]|jgi:dipeptidyl aminopeptidase/acylaminoacyl peptidase|nr:hypothetical protein [Sphingomonadales bacterium]
MRGRRPLERFALFPLILVALASCSRGPGTGAETLIHPDAPGARVEYFVRAPKIAGPRPTILFLHGHQPPLARPGGEAFVKWGILDRYAGKGYLAVAVSLPGYGGSSGPEDFAGPFAQHAVEAVIARLEAQHRAAPGKVLIQGVSLGAVTAALVAGRRRDVAGLVLISGLYDLPAFLDPPRSPAARDIEAALIRQTGGGGEALRSRSALLVAGQIKARTLILNGARDDRTDPGQARRLAERLNAGGTYARVHIYPGFGHEIPVAARQAEVDAFIASTLRP